MKDDVKSDDGEEDKEEVEEDFDTVIKEEKEDKNISEYIKLSIVE